VKPHQDQAHFDFRYIIRFSTNALPSSIDFHSSKTGPIIQSNQIPNGSGYFGSRSVLSKYGNLFHSVTPSVSISDLQCSLIMDVRKSSPRGAPTTFVFMPGIPLDSETLKAGGRTILLDRERRISSLASARGKMGDRSKKAEGGRIGFSKARKYLNEAKHAENPTVEQQGRLERNRNRSKTMVVTKRERNLDWGMAKFKLNGNWQLWGISLAGVSGLISLSIFQEKEDCRTARDAMVDREELLKVKFDVAGPDCDHQNIFRQFLDDYLKSLSPGSMKLGRVNAATRENDLSERLSLRGKELTPAEKLDFILKLYDEIPVLFGKFDLSSYTNSARTFVNRTLVSVRECLVNHFNGNKVDFLKKYPTLPYSHFSECCTAPGRAESHCVPKK
jgi:hypothetical protein